MTAKEYFIGILVGGVLGGKNQRHNSSYNGVKILTGNAKKAWVNILWQLPFLVRLYPNDLPEMDIELNRDMPNSISKMGAANFVQKFREGMELVIQPKRLLEVKVII